MIRILRWFSRPRLAKRPIHSFLIAPFQHSIGNRVLLVVGILGSLILATMSLISIKDLEKGLMEQNEHIHSKLAETASRGLQAIMLAGYAEIAHEYAKQIKEVKNLNDFRILRVNGMEAFKDNTTIDDVNKRVGEERFLPRDKEEHVVVLKPDHEQLNKVAKEGNILSYHPDHDRKLLNYLAPIRNEKACYRCHGKEGQVRGVLLLSTSLDEVREKITTARIKGIVLLVTSLSVFLFLLRLVLRNAINRPIATVQDGIRALAKGNLCDRIPGTDQHPDEIGLIRQDVNVMADNLVNHIRMVVRESHNLFADLRNIVEIKEKLFHGTEMAQAISHNVVELNRNLDRDVVNMRNALGEASIDTNVVAGAMEQLSGNVTLIAHAAQSASNNVKEIAALSADVSQRTLRVREGLDQVNATVQDVIKAGNDMKTSAMHVKKCSSRAMDAADITAETAANADRTMLEMTQAATEIGSIVNIIRLIASHSQMVAINAAIEAGRAGESGKGFIAVAKEVRELAIRTEQATLKISGMITHVQENAAKASNAIIEMTAITKQIVAANQEIEQAVKTQGIALTRIDNATENVHRETRILMEQAAGIGQAAQQTAHSAAEAADSNQEIARLIEEASQSAISVTGKAGNVHGVIFDLLEFAKKTETISGVVKGNMVEAFQLTENVRNLTIALDHVVNSMRDVCSTMESAHGNLDVGDPPFDMELIKGDDFKWVVRLQESLGGADISPLSPELPCALHHWLDEHRDTLPRHLPLDSLLQVHDQYHLLAKEIFYLSPEDKKRIGQEKFRLMGQVRKNLTVELDHLFELLWHQGIEEKKGGPPSRE
ncbi:MAG: HAMP domain-containing protein [Magnetococcales bacterium]|nr:HAMP domain-containing protein [Magnetococcales bacterium]MBF0148734.1 HAMP domain-containing protein [Magnetococcales bacterium]